MRPLHSSAYLPFIKERVFSPASGCQTGPQIVCSEIYLSRILADTEREMTCISESMVDLGLLRVNNQINLVKFYTCVLLTVA